MSPIKLLTLLFKQKNILRLPLYFSLILLVACTNIYQGSYTQQVFVKDIQEKEGMVMKHALLSYFPNTNYKETRYTLDTIISKTDDLYLTSKNNFGTKGRIKLNVIWTILDKKTNKIITSLSSVYYQTYTISPTGSANRSSVRITLENLSISAAKDIALKTYIFLERYEDTTAKS